MKTKIIGTLICATSISACATSPDNIHASYVAPALYSSYDCAQTKVELMRVSDEVSKVTGQQQNKANNDKWATGVGIVVFWPALFFLAVGDKKNQLSHLKGQYDALLINANEKKCGYAHDLRPS